MRLKTIEFELNWPSIIKVSNLRNFIVDKLSKKGKVVRWSINNIKNSASSQNEKILLINAVIIF